MGVLLVAPHTHIQEVQMQSHLRKVLTEPRCVVINRLNKMVLNSEHVDGRRQKGGGGAATGLMPSHDVHLLNWIEGMGLDEMGKKRAKRRAHVSLFDGLQ